MFFSPAPLTYKFPEPSAENKKDMVLKPLVPCRLTKENKEDTVPLILHTILKEN